MLEKIKNKYCKPIRKKGEVMRMKLFGILSVILSVNLALFAVDFEKKGDFRVRTQWENDGNSSRFRERIRLRYSVTGEIDDLWKIGFGVATGGSDPRSTNETLDNSFETPDLRLDHAFAEAKVLNGLEVWFGKYKEIKKAICCLSGLLWDSDLRPEGLGIKWVKEYNNKNLFFNTGMWIIDEIKKGDDPYLVYFQPGFDFVKSDNVELQMYVGCYLFGNVKGKALDHSPGTNTLSSGNLKYDYDVFSPGMRIMFDNSSKFTLSLFVEGVVNIDIDKSNKGYLLGVGVSNDNGWKLEISHGRLERDAWLDIFSDSDEFNGQTGTQGQKINISKKVSKHTSVRADYIHLEDLITNDNLNVCKLDMLWSF